MLTEVYCQGEALSKGNIYLRFLRTWTPKNFLFLWLLSNFPLRLVISPLIALTDNLEYVGSLSLVSLFTLKTCCQLFPFRMESSPGEWLVAFRSRFGTTSQHSLSLPNQPPLCGYHTRCVSSVWYLQIIQMCSFTCSTEDVVCGLFFIYFFVILVALTLFKRGHGKIWNQAISLLWQINNI